MKVNFILYVPQYIQANGADFCLNLLLVERSGCGLF